MTRPEEKKSILVGVILSICLLLQFGIDHFSAKISDIYQNQQQENFKLVTYYAEANDLYLQVININDTIEKLFSWKQGETPFIEVKVKTISEVYHKLNKEEQEQWGDKTLYEFYWNKKNSLIKNANKKYTDIDELQRVQQKEGNEGNIKIKKYTKLITMLSLFNIALIASTIFLNYSIIKGIATRINSKQKESAK